MRVLPPEVVVLNGQFLNFTGQRSEQIPKPPGCNRFHCCGGQSRRSPCADSLSPSSNKKSIAEQSRDPSARPIGCVQERRNHSRKRRYSSGGKLLTAASISSTRFMPEVDHWLSTQL